VRIADRIPPPPPPPPLPSQPIVSWLPLPPPLPPGAPPPPPFYCALDFISYSANASTGGGFELGRDDSLLAEFRFLERLFTRSTAASSCWAEAEAEASRAWSCIGLSDADEVVVEERPSVGRREPHAGGRVLDLCGAKIVDNGLLDVADRTFFVRYMIGDLEGSEAAMAASCHRIQHALLCGVSLHSNPSRASALLGSDEIAGSCVTYGAALPTRVCTNSAALPTPQCTCTSGTSQFEFDHGLDAVPIERNASAFAAPSAPPPPPPPVALHASAPFFPLPARASAPPLPPPAQSPKAGSSDPAASSLPALAAPPSAPMPNDPAHASNKSAPPALAPSSLRARPPPLSAPAVHVPTLLAVLGGIVGCGFYACFLAASYQYWQRHQKRQRARRTRARVDIPRPSATCGQPRAVELNPPPRSSKRKPPTSTQPERSSWSSSEEEHKGSQRPIAKHAPQWTPEPEWGGRPQPAGPGDRRSAKRAPHPSRNSTATEAKYGPLPPQCSSVRMVAEEKAAAEKAVVEAEARLAAAAAESERARLAAEKAEAVAGAVAVERARAEKEKAVAVAAAVAAERRRRQVAEEAVAVERARVEEEKVVAVAAAVAAERRRQEAEDSAAAEQVASARAAAAAEAAARPASPDLQRQEEQERARLNERLREQDRVNVLEVKLARVDALIAAEALQREREAEEYGRAQLDARLREQALLQRERAAKACASLTSAPPLDPPRARHRAPHLPTSSPTSSPLVHSNIGFAAHSAAANVSAARPPHSSLRPALARAQTANEIKRRGVLPPSPANGTPAASGSVGSVNSTARLSARPPPPPPSVNSTARPPPPRPPPPTPLSRAATARQIGSVHSTARLGARATPPRPSRPAPLSRAATARQMGTGAWTDNIYDYDSS